MVDSRRILGAGGRLVLCCLSVNADEGDRRYSDSLRQSACAFCLDRVGNCDSGEKRHSGKSNFKYNIFSWLLFLFDNSQPK